MKFTHLIICVLLGSLLNTQSAMAVIKHGEASSLLLLHATESSLTEPASSAVTTALTLTLESDGPTQLGNATHLTTTLNLDAVMRFKLSTVVSGEAEIGSNSLVIGADGLPLIGYTVNGDFSILNLVKCLIPDCSSSISTTVDSGTAIHAVSLAIGADELPVISYNSNKFLNFAKCLTKDCTQVVSTTVDNHIQIGGPSAISLVIGMDGLPIIPFAYTDTFYGGLAVRKCQTISCTSSTYTDLDPEAGVAVGLSAVIGVDGLPLISYNDAPHGDLKIVRCQTLQCSVPITTTLDSEGNVGYNNSLQINADGLPVIVYDDASNPSNVTSKILRCQTINCSEVISSPLGVAFTSSAIGTDKLLVGTTSSSEGIPSRLGVVKCRTVNCSSVMSMMLDPRNFADSYHGSTVIGTDGLPVISYIARDASFIGGIPTAVIKLKVAKALPSPTYMLNYGDGSPVVTGNWSIDLLSFSHTYAAPGNYTIVITATDGAISNSASSIVTIKSPPPIRVTLNPFNSESRFLQGDETHLVATLNPDTAARGLPITTYLLDYGDGSPIVMGNWNVSAVLPFTHTYAVGSFTAVLTATDGSSSDIARTSLDVVARGSLTGTLTNVQQGRLITYTLTVTNPSGTLSAMNVLISGSVPANARLIDKSAALEFLPGGDYGSGYVQAITGIALLPGQSVQASWLVEAFTLPDDVVTRGHATSNTYESAFKVTNYIARMHVYMPLIRKDIAMRY